MIQSDWQKDIRSILQQTETNLDSRRHFINPTSSTSNSFGNSSPLANSLPIRNYAYTPTRVPFSTLSLSGSRNLEYVEEDRQQHSVSIFKVLPPITSNNLQLRPKEEQGL